MCSQQQPFKTLVFVLVYIFLTGKTQAQGPVDFLAKLNENLPVQAVYLQHDKAAYAAGDTIWMKAVLYSDFRNSDLSYNLFTELTTASGKLIDAKYLPVISGGAPGFFSLPDTLTEGVYVLRTYTPWILNSGNKNINYTVIPVFNPKKRTNTSSFKTLQRLLAVPEDGRLTSGVTNKIYIRTSDSFGRPEKAEGAVTDEQGKNVATFQTDANGTALVTLTPVAGVTYTVKAVFASQPAATVNLKTPEQPGWYLSTTPHEKGLLYTIIAPPGAETAADKVLLVGSIQQYSVFQQPLVFKNNQASGVIPTGGLFPGILHLSVFHKDNQLLAEKSVLVNPSSYKAEPVLTKKQINLSPKAKNIIRFSFPDTLEGEFSLCITDADRDFQDELGENILQGLWVNSSSQDRTWVSVADIIQPKPLENEITGGLYAWNRPDWSGMNKSELPVPTVLDRNYITLTGTVYKEDGKKKEAEGELLFYLRMKDSSASFFQTPVDAEGHFSAENLVFTDTAGVFYKYTDKKGKDKPAEIRLNTQPLIPADFRFTGPADSKIAAAESALYDKKLEEKRQAVTAYTEENGDSKISMMDEVIVKTRVKSPTMIVNEQYTSGLFYSMGRSKVFDLINDPPRTGAMNIFEYLQGRIGGLVINRSGDSYQIWSPRSVTITGGPVPAVIFVNEMELDVRYAQNIPMASIALVKYFPPTGLNYPGVGMAPVLAIYTKKGADNTYNNTKGLKTFKAAGYSPEAIFFLPEYSKPAENPKDNRTTLYWEPRFPVGPNADNQDIVFYNSSVTKRVRIRLEGVATDGRVVCFETVIDQ